MKRFGELLRVVLVASAAIFLYATSATAQPIDRQALVSRHNVIVRAADPMGPIAVGNGQFAFNADITGLQTFPDYYARTMPIGILANWGWHSFPNPQGYSLEKFKFTSFPKYDRAAWYPYIQTDNRDRITDAMLSDEARYLRANPHKFGLGRIGLLMTRADGSAVGIDDLHNIEQKLDLWTGLLTSRFEIEGVPVRVETAAHPVRDEVGIRVDSPLVASGRLKIQIAFAYPSGSWGLDYEDWTKPDAHQTELHRRETPGAIFHRTIDGMSYDVDLLANWKQGVELSEAAKHFYVLGGSPQTTRLEATLWFSPAAISGQTDSVEQVQQASAEHWRSFWSSGGAIDLSGNDDPRAAELERRIVLSQYVTAVHSAGDWPPQETGLACNSWYGKFHMEMYWWHVAHFALWGRPELLERSLSHLQQMLPAAEAMARRQASSGAKWAKMTDPSGNESPSWVGPMLIWQQPHPIHLAELVYRARHNDRATLERYSPIVFATADFIASFMDFDPQRKQYVLGPGIGSADEGHTDYAHNLNPTMELGYFAWALEMAQQWHTRLGQPRNPKWDDVLNHMSPLPIRNGVYPTLEAPVDNAASWMATWLYGVLPGKGIDRDVMRNTLRAAAASRTNRAQNTVTWGFPMVAMCAARMGEPEVAIELLVGKYDKNPFLPQGYAYRNSTQTPLYLPASGGWLSAAAMMAAGWDGAPKDVPAPGFPRTWKVRYEGLNPMP